jgi:type I restriction enzyme, S subunit
MKFEKLGNIADIIAGQSPPSSTYNSEGNGIPFFQGKADYGEKYPTVRYWCTVPTKISLPNDILISMRAPVGPVNINTVESCIGRGLSAIRVKKNVSRDFLYFWLKQNQHIIAAKQTGSTFKAITQKILSEIIVPFPCYTDQLHIANLLSKAENLISQRKESIRLLDEFLKSTFLEMFGDPVRNEKGWKINSLSKFGSLKNGLNYTKAETGVNIHCLGVGDFKNLSKLTDIESLQILSLTTEPSKDYFLKDGDLVFVRSNGNRELVGRCLLVFPKSAKVTFSGFSIRYRIENAGLNPIFLSHLFRVPIFRTSMLQGGKGANIQNISQQTLEKLKIPTPPLSLQTQFAQIVEKTEALKPNTNKAYRSWKICMAV